MNDEPVVLNELIHQSTRLRIMTLLVDRSSDDLTSYGFIQSTLKLTGGNLTIHLRKLAESGYVTTSKEFVGEKPRTWVQATDEGRLAYGDYLVNLKRALNLPLE